MSSLKKYLAAGLLAILLVGAAGGFYWATRPLQLASPVVDVTIRGTLRDVVQQLNAHGVPVQRGLFVVMARLLGAQTQLKAGNYEFKDGVTPYELLKKIVQGDVNQYSISIIEGWTFKRMRAQVDANPAFKHESVGMTDAQLLRAIGADETGLSNAEGLFFPDTYLFDKDTSDLNLYRRAYQLMKARLNDAWEARAPGLPLKTPYEALIMASLIEKETSMAADRPLVSSVFDNRLRIGMPLQTDPTVIYSLGDAYTGRLHKSDLHTDTPYNTYTRKGLPPTPIALVGAAALQAALNPAQTDALYFVSRGDGSSEFSDTLNAHNKAVFKYIRGQ